MSHALDAGGSEGERTARMRSRKKTGGHPGTAPRKAAENIEALAVAAAEVEAEDGREDEQHRCEVAANHYGCLGDRIKAQ